MSPDEIRARWPEGVPRPPWLTQGNLVIFLAFTGSAAAVLAQAEAISAILRVCAAAYGAGCTAALALLRPPSSPPSGGPGRG